MKNLIYIVVALFAFNVNASFFQEDCSSANGEIKMHSGHVKNGLTVVKRTYATGQAKEEVVELDLYELDVDESEVQILNSVSKNGCEQ